MSESKYKWKYVTVGGVTRVNVQSGADITHLSELDRKLWTVLSCPTVGLEFDARTLALLDTNADGRIHVDEVIAASQWLGAVLADPDVLLKGTDTLPLAAINAESEEGKAVLDTAKRVLANLEGRCRQHHRVRHRRRRGRLRQDEVQWRWRHHPR